MGDNGGVFSLKVDGLSPQGDKHQLREQLREAFKVYGEITDVYIPREKSYGFVRFRNHEDALMALETMDGTELSGRELHCSFAMREKEKDMPESDRPSGATNPRDVGMIQPPQKKARHGHGPFVFKLLGSEHVVSAIIGKGGQALRDLQEETGSRVDFSHRGCHFPETRCRIITIQGESAESVARVLDSFVDRIHEASTNLTDEPSKGRYPGDIRVVALVARYVAGSLLGKGGEDMRRLQAELQCFIEVEKTSTIVSEGHQRVEIRGNDEVVKRALRVVNEKVAAEVDRDWFPAWAAQDPLASLQHRPPPEEHRGPMPSHRDRGGAGHAALPQPHPHHRPAEYGPTHEELAIFRQRYPVDDRCWGYFTSTTGAIQVKVLQDFKPSSRGGPKGGEDFSALLTSFVANVTKRYTDHPAGFKKGLETAGMPEDEGRPPHSGGHGGGHGGGHSGGHSSSHGSQEMLMERPPSRDDSAFHQTMEDIPLKYLAYDYAITCDLPEERCKPLRQCQEELASQTRTEIEITHSEVEGVLRVSVVGRLPDVYTAHLRLMWEFNAGEEAAKQPPQQNEQMEAMKAEIARLQAQLEAVSHHGGGTPPQRGRQPPPQQRGPPAHQQRGGPPPQQRGRPLPSRR